MTSLERETLQQRWVHSHEEDTETETVFRPASYSFPRSRGRAALELRPDGSYGESAPGPTDRPEETAAGMWKLEGKKLTLRQPDGSTRVLNVASVARDRLVVKK